MQAISEFGSYITSYNPPGVDDWQALGLSVGPQGHVAAGDALNNVVWLIEPSSGVDLSSGAPVIVRRGKGDVSAFE